MGEVIDLASRRRLDWDAIEEDEDDMESYIDHLTIRDNHEIEFRGLGPEFSLVNPARIDIEIKPRCDSPQRDELLWLIVKCVMFCGGGISFLCVVGFFFLSRFYQ